ncbi:MAG: penicillin-binding transpeptidase domain-containing protein [Candidatus Kaiserbacteria bacterium]|nr:penicillin-binding transpeptidase domain-containing protein [Candidatus Kaiserbacteria bacterium]
MKWRKKRRRDPEIAPDEIFLDASNVPAFDRARFEGRLEKPLSQKTFISLAITLGALFLILIIRIWDLQVINGAIFAAESAHNSLEVATLFAPRGIITDFRGIMLAENISKTDGSVGRKYSLPSLGQIIGYVSYPKKDSKGIYYDTSETGIAGLEAEYNSLLAGKNGQLLTEKDVLGNIRSEGIIVPAKEGGTLRLSIDANLEQLFARAIADTASSNNFIAGAGVILDVHTGAVRAIVSYPSYDPNVMANGGPSDRIASYNTNAGHPFLDHAVQGVYTPGSIVKPFVASGALTDGLITPNTTIEDPGFLSLPDPYHPGKKFIYKGWKALGAVDVRKAIAWSSDIFFYTVGGGFGSQKGLGIDRLGYWYQQFGLGSQTGIDLPGEASGLIPTPAWKKTTFNEPWYLGDTYFTAIGQYSVQVTPIQMARATAAVANGGTLLVPTLLADATPVSTIVPVSPTALAVVREGMRKGVTEALASAINFPYVAVAAKTGTAQTGVHNQYDNSWVEGFFPYDNPQYAFAVVLERGPQGTGEQAVNVMQQLFESLHAENSPYVGQ